MNKQLRTLLAFFAIGITAAAVPAFAGELEPFHVTVPFAFKAGATVLPAGNYTVKEDSSHVVFLQGNRCGAILLATTGEESSDDKTALNFERTDKGYYLKSVQASGRPTSVVRFSPAVEQ